MPGPSGPGYIVVKTINGHRYRYRQWSWREPGRSHPRTQCQYLGPAHSTARKGDVVRAIETLTGRIVEREVRSVKDDALALVEPTSGIPFKYAYDKWSFEVIRRAPRPRPLQFKTGDQFIDRHDGELMTIAKVLSEHGKYVLYGATGADATVTESRLLEGHRPHAISDPVKHIALLELELRNRYADSPHGPLKADLQLPKPSPDDVLDFGEVHMTYTERLATWQTRADELAAQSKVEAAFAQVRAEFELSEPGYRVITDDAHQHGGLGVYAVPSTFPDWVPDHLRRKKLFNRLLADLTPDRITYPARANAHRQRALIHSILDRVDRLAGIDTSEIREKIMLIYGPRNTRTTA